MRPDLISEVWPALPWLLPFLTLPRLARRTPNLSRVTPAQGQFVSIIIPARNEEQNIETLLTSLLRSRYSPFEILVVNDRSTDGTALRANNVPDPRIRLMEGGDLPSGWFGKPWACYQGYREAQGNLLLFTDADTRHQPELLGHAVGALLTEQADLVTISPRQLCLTFWERVIMPQIWFLLALRYSPASVNRAKRPRDVIANGQFILTTREAYERVGTHQEVRGEVAEDLALAQTYVTRGLKLHFAFAERLMETRMYRGLQDLIEGWSKNIYLGGRRSFPDEPMSRALVPVILLVALTFWLIPPATLLAALGTGSNALTLPAMLATLASAAFWTLLCAGMRIPLLYGLTFPLGAAMGIYIAFRSTLRGRRRVEWRGRVYSSSGESASAERSRR